MGMGPRMREDTDYEWGGVSPVLLGLIMALLCLGERGRAVREPPLRGMGMGPRMREDTDYEWGAFLLNLLGLIMALGLGAAPTGRISSGTCGSRRGPRMREDTPPKFIGVDYGLVVPR